MARSYFSRMVRGGGAVGLAPQRPVSNLWKSAQMEGAAVETAVEAPVDAPFRRVRGVVPAAEPEREPAVPANVETRPEIREVALVRRRQVVKSSAGLPETAPREVRPHEVAPREVVSRKVSAREPVRLEPTPTTSPTEAPAARSAGERAAAEAAAVERPRLDGRAAQKSDADLLPHQEPLHTRTQESARTMQQEESAVTAAPELKRAVEAAPLVELEPARSTEPVRHRERAAWNAPAQEQSRASSGNSVQIGKIEVQVISPPAPVRYAAAPAAPKGRLARGYTLWQAWQ